MFLERWLVPMVLITVGVIQIFLTQTVGLSPWKGGGFGMFAAIDSPSMRVLATEALTQDNQRIRLEVLYDLDHSTRQRIRSVPKETELEQLAGQLLTQTFVPMGFRRQTAYRSLQSQNPDVSRLLQPSSGSTPSSERRLPLYRLKRSTDPVPAERTVKMLKAVRLQWWQLQFDAQKISLSAKPLSLPIEAGEWP